MVNTRNNCQIHHLGDVGVEKWSPFLDSENSENAKSAHFQVPENGTSSTRIHFWQCQDFGSAYCCNPSLSVQCLLFSLLCAMQFAVYGV